MSVEPNGVESLHALVSELRHLAWVTEGGGAIRHCTPQALSYLGLEPHDLTGWDWLWAVHPADLPFVRRAIQGALQTGMPGRVRFRLRRSDGDYRPHQGHVTPWHDREGRTCRWLILSADLTVMTGAAGAADCP